MLKLRHLSWLVMVAVLIACGEPAITGVHYGENQEAENHGGEVAHVDGEVEITEGEAVVEESVAEPTPVPTSEPTSAPVEYPIQIPTAGATEVANDTSGGESAEPVDLAESETVAVTGDPVLGQQVFTMNACSACHMVDSENTLVGPGLMNISDHAGSRVSGLSAMEYIRQSIVEPNTYIVPNFSMGIMPQTFGTTLSEADLNNLIAYLMSL